MEVKLEKTPELMLPVTTKPKKQWQRLNLYGHFIQMASDLRRWRVNTLTGHLSFSFQDNIFYDREWTRCSERVWNLGRIRWKKLQHPHPGQSGVPRDQWLSVPPCNTMAQMPPLVPRWWSLAVPQGVGCPSQEPGWALSVVSETKALTHALSARLINYLP